MMSAGEACQLRGLGYALQDNNYFESEIVSGASWDEVVRVWQPILPNLDTVSQALFREV